MKNSSFARFRSCFDQFRFSIIDAFFYRERLVLRLALLFTDFDLSDLERLRVMHFLLFGLVLRLEDLFPVLDLLLTDLDLLHVLLPDLLVLRDLDLFINFDLIALHLITSFEDLARDFFTVVFLILRDAVHLFLANFLDLFLIFF